MRAKNLTLLCLTALLIVCLIVPSAFAATVPLEQTMSARYSVRGWSSTNIPALQLLQVLQSAYGYAEGHRNVPRVGNSYSLDLFVANATATYRYNPDTNTLTVHTPAVNKLTLRPRFSQNYLSDANAIIIIVWDQTKMGNQYYACAEAGLVVQNTYLAAVSIDLGTVCVAMIDSNGIRSDLSLASTMAPLLVMPLGYPTTPYQSVTPDYSRMLGNLPTVKIGTASFANTLNNLLYAQTWSNENISAQELSQLLWASYGYSSTGHRTVPSALSVYPFKIWFLNSTGSYEYTPQSHSVTLKVSGDKRSQVANVFGTQNWASNAPTTFLIVYDSSLGGEGGVVTHEWSEVDAGTIAENILLEGAAWGVSGNIVSSSLEQWNGSGSTSIRSLLDMPSSLILLFAVPVGHGGAIPEFPTSLALFALLAATALIVALFLASRRRIQYTFPAIF